MGSKCYAVVLIILLLVWVSGCSTKPLTTAISHDYTYTAGRVLVLPFINDSDEKQAGILATRICQSLCYNHGFHVANEGDLRIYLQRKHLFLSQLTEESTPQVFAELARELQVTTLIKGRILALHYEKTQGESLPVISLQLEILDAGNGKLLASSFLTERGEDYRILLRFGVIRTTTQLLEQMIQHIINDWHNKGVLLCPTLS